MYAGNVRHFFTMIFNLMSILQKNSIGLSIELIDKYSDC